MIDRVVIQLNETWWLGHDGALQWILGHRHKNGAVSGRHFCGTREGLLRCIREHVGEITLEARTFVDGLPPLYRLWREAGFPMPEGRDVCGRGAVEPLGGVRVADEVQRDCGDSFSGKTAA